MKNTLFIELGKHRKRALFMCFPILLIILMLLFAGRFLVFSQTSQKSDVIIVLSGGSGRVEKAAELFKEGYAAKLILTNVNGYAGPLGDMLETAIANGIPEDDILTENKAKSTYENAQFTLPLLQEFNFKSALVVTSDFHMRRVKFNFDSVYRKSDIQLTYVASETKFKNSNWWKDEFSRGLVFEEYSKMIGNFLGYNGPEAKKVLNRFKSWFS